MADEGTLARGGTGQGVAAGMGQQPVHMGDTEWQAVRGTWEQY